MKQLTLSLVAVIILSVFTHIMWVEADVWGAVMVVLAHGSMAYILRRHVLLSKVLTAVLSVLVVVNLILGFLLIRFYPSSIPWFGITPGFLIVGNLLYARIIKLMDPSTAIWLIDGREDTTERT